MFYLYRDLWPVFLWYLCFPLLETTIQFEVAVEQLPCSEVPRWTNNVIDIPSTIQKTSPAASFKQTKPSTRPKHPLPPINSRRCPEPAQYGSRFRCHRRTLRRYKENKPVLYGLGDLDYLVQGALHCRESCDTVASSPSGLWEVNSLCVNFAFPQIGQHYHLIRKYWIFYPGL